MSSTSPTEWARLVGFATALVALMALPAVAWALTSTITSAGPLDEIIIGDQLNCQVGHVDDDAFEFYAPFYELGACATQIAVGGQVFGPELIPAGNSPEPFTPVSQSGVTGTGTATDPFSVETVVDVGDTGLRIVETDSYVVGTEAYRTDVSVVNTGGADVPVIVYRAGDCYLQDSDFGFGRIDVQTGAVTCVASDDGVTPGDRIEQWIPLTPGSHFYEAFYADVWDVIQSGAEFDDSCTCDTYLDNGAGLSWALTVPAGGSVLVSHLTVFSPQGVEPLTLSKSAVSPSSIAGDTNGYTITVSNPNDVEATLVSMTDDLPAPFTYVPGSTIGAGEPTVAGNVLTWAGPIVVPANASITVTFNVVVDGDGTYTNQVEALAGAVTVIPTGPTAPITVTPEPSNEPPMVGVVETVGGSEGSPIGLDASVSDPDGDALTLAWSYAPGAGVDPGATCSFSDSSIEDPTITCTDDGEYVVTLTVDDGVNPAVSDTADVVVANVDPTVEITTPGDGSGHFVGAVVELSAVIEDAGDNDAHTCSIDWGDGSPTTEGTVIDGLCVGSHVYQAIAVPTVTVTVTDDDAGVAVDEIMLIVSVPGAKVTGGGWLLAPDGTRVSFGLVADGTEGQIQVRLHNSDRFHGTDVEGLTSVGSTATWSGPGRWNGADGYEYEVTVADNGNGRSKKGSPDTISLVVRDSTGAVVWSVSGPLGGGNLKVH